MQFEWIGTIPTKYQPLWEESDDTFPFFLQHLPQYARWDIPLIGALDFHNCTIAVFSHSLHG